AMQIYWRSLAVPVLQDVEALEMMVLTQTNQLGTQIKVITQSQLPAAEVLQLDHQQGFDRLEFQEPLEITPADGTGCLVFRFAGHETSYVEMVHPVDFTSAILSVERTGCLLQRTAVDRSMEKGVIVRARLCAAFVPRSDDINRAAAVYQEFCRTEVPLTV
ncbi:MAG: hypothetical protein N2C12_09920, partial [Planctomycetales bacterium]